MKVQVPSGALDEYTGELLDEKKLGEGMKLEMEELDHFESHRGAIVLYCFCVKRLRCRNRQPNCLKPLLL